jgi:hypothetical protein
LERIMTSARRTVSRGALLVALMASPGVLAGGAAHADVLGGTGAVPLPAPLPPVPRLPEPSPSPSPPPSPTASATAAAPAPEQQTTSTGTTQSAAPASTTDAGTAPAPVADDSAAAAPASQEVAASGATAPAPVAAPAPAPAAQSPVSTRVAAAQPATAPAVSVVARPAAAPATATTVASAPHAAARLDLLDGATPNAAGSFSGFPHLTAGSMELPALPQLPGLRPMIAPGQATQVAPLLAGGPTVGGVPVVRTGHSTPIQPGSTGIVLFVMASAAGAAGLARVRIYRRSVIRR